MYEHQTFEAILQRMLDRVPSNLDKREGSVIYDALAPAAAELAQMYIELDITRELSFADTAPREYLVRRAAERGLAPYPATSAKLKGVFDVDVPIGSRFSGEELDYVVVERLGPGEYVLECETPGAIGNTYLGRIIPIDYIAGLTTAELVEVLIPGEDEEDTEAFRERYFASFSPEAFGGNRADYKQKVMQIPGVGGVRVYRAKYGPGTVGLTIIDSQYQVPSQELIAAVQNAVDPPEHTGEGVGLAPIDHHVFVEPVKEYVIDITLNITYQSGWTWVDVEEEVKAVIDDYFRELAREWAAARSYEEDHTGLIVRVLQIESRLLNVEGILDVTDTLLNGQPSNLVLDKEAIPVRGVVVG